MPCFAPATDREVPRIEAGLYRSSNRSSGLHYIDFVAKHGRLYANGEPFFLKGVNWFGSESRVGPPGGLNIHSISWYMDFLARHGFNAIRLLFNHESILSNALVETSELLAAPELKGANYLAMFGRIAREAARRGLLVMLACHRIHPSAWPGDGLWYDRSGPITEASVLQSWDAIAAAFCDAHWNVFAVDLVRHTLPCATHPCRHAPHQCAAARRHTCPPILTVSACDLVVCVRTSLCIHASCTRADLGRLEVTHRVGGGAEAEQSEMRRTSHVGCGHSLLCVAKRSAQNNTTSLGLFLCVHHGGSRSRSR